MLQRDRSEHIIIVFIISPRRSTTFVDTACCHRPSRVVSLSVCHDREPCKNGRTSRNAVWVVELGGLKEPCRVQITHGKGQF